MNNNRKYSAKANALRFVISQDKPEVGWYLYVYSGDKCIADHLQDSLDKAKEMALEKYAVPFSLWREDQ